MPPLLPEPVPEPCMTTSPSWVPPASVSVGFSISLSGTLLQVQSAQVKLPRSIQRLARRLLKVSDAPLYSCSRSPLVRKPPPRVDTPGPSSYQVIGRVEPSGRAWLKVIGM